MISLTLRFTAEEYRSLRAYAPSGVTRRPQLTDFYARLVLDAVGLPRRKLFGHVSVRRRGDRDAGQA